MEESGPRDIALLNTDQWVANSLLQKAIRRGQTEVAQRAALTFFSLRGSAIWRRLALIAVEDIGVAAIDVVGEVVFTGFDTVDRKRLSDLTTIVHLAGLMAGAPKSRSAEHLITAARYHPVFETDRASVTGNSNSENLSIVSNASESLVRQALAVAEIYRTKESRESSEGGLPLLLDTFRKLRLPEALIAATKRARDPITFMPPLIWLKTSGKISAIEACELPASPCVNDIPLYALDKHTRLGREAIRIFLRSTGPIRDCLARYVAPHRWNEAAYMAAFYADASPLAHKAIWDGADHLERLGTDADMLRTGVLAEGIIPVLHAFRSNITALNEARMRVVRKNDHARDQFAPLLPGIFWP